MPRSRACGRCGIPLLIVKTIFIKKVFCQENFLTARTGPSPRRRIFRNNRNKLEKCIDARSGGTYISNENHFQ